MANLAKFEITGIEVPLPENWYFHDEGSSKIDEFTFDEKPQSITGRSFEIMVNQLSKSLAYAKKIDVSEVKEEAEDIVLFKGRYYSEFMNRVSSVFGTTLSYEINFGNGKERHIHMLYLDKGRSDVNLQIIAHEEQHAITHIPGGIQILEKKILEDTGKHLYFNRIKDPELAADCNVVYVFNKKCYELNE